MYYEVVYHYASLYSHSNIFQYHLQALPLVF